MRPARPAALASAIVFAQAALAADPHDLDFVAEHLPEAAMDNRFLTLPLWHTGVPAEGSWSWQLQGNFAEVRSGNLSLDGTGTAVSVRYGLGSRWSIVALGFFDPMSFGGGAEVRPLAPRFTDIPLDLPALASVTNFGGRMHHFGVGLATVLQPAHGARSFALGLLLDRLELQRFRADYRLLSGASAGSFGRIDYSASYPSWVPFAAAEWRLGTDDWVFAPRFVAGWPLPRSGWKGAIFGPGFDVAGDTSDVGRGVHIPDPFGGFGLGVGYTPWRLSVDAGALVNQALGEPLIHDGIDVVWLLSVNWDPVAR